MPAPLNDLSQTLERFLINTLRQMIESGKHEADLKMVFGDNGGNIEATMRLSLEGLRELPEDEHSDD